MKEHMTNAAFVKAVARTRIKETGREAARLVLVDGFTSAEAGRRTGVSRSYVHQIVKRVIDEQSSLRRCPNGKHLITLCVDDEQELAIKTILEK